MKAVKLEDVCTIVSGGTPSRAKAEYWQGGNIPWIKISDIKGKFVNDTEECITKEGLDGSSAKMLQKGTLLYTIFATLGEVGVLNIDACTNQAIAGITINKPEEVCSDYLYYYLKSKKSYVSGIGRGVAQNNINMSILRNFVVPLPSVEEQHSISRTLEKAHEIISSRKTELSILDDLIKARFVEMFGDPDTNPMCWSECLLSEMLEVLGGYAFKSDGFSEVEGIPVLRIGNINAGFFKPVNMVFWEEDEALERYAMYPGDLVMSLTGTVGKDDYGNVCILGNNYCKYYLNQRNAKLELKKGLDKYYLSQLLRFEKIKKRLTGINRGVRQANISNRDILGLKVPIPPIELQQQFSIFVAQVDKSKVVVQKALDEAQLLFDSLMQKYFG